MDYQVPDISFDQDGLSTFHMIPSACKHLVLIPRWANWEYQIDAFTGNLGRYAVWHGQPISAGDDSSRFGFYQDAREQCGSDVGLAFMATTKLIDQHHEECDAFEVMNGCTLYFVTEGADTESVRWEEAGQPVDPSQAGVMSAGLEPTTMEDPSSTDMIAYLLENAVSTPHSLRIGLEKFQPRPEDFLKPDALKHLHAYCHDPSREAYAVVIDEYIARARFSGRTCDKIRKKMVEVGHDPQSRYEEGIQASAWMQDPPERMVPQHPDLLYRTGVTVLGGRPKAGKSFLALDLAVAIASGGPFVGKYPMAHAGDVLYLALEDNPQRFYKRLQGLLPDGDLPDRMRVHFEYSRMGEGFIKDLAYWAQQQAAPRLVVIDVWSHVQSARNIKESIYSDEYADMNALKQFTYDYDCHVMLVTHLNKNYTQAANPADAIMSSTAITGGASNIWVLQAEKGEDDMTSSLAISGKDVPSWELALNWVTQTGSPYWEAVGDKRSVQGKTMRRMILFTLYKWSGMAPTQTELRKDIDPDYSPGSFHNLLTDLHKKGLILIDSRKRITLSHTGASEASADHEQFKDEDDNQTDDNVDIDDELDDLL